MTDDEDWNETKWLTFSTDQDIRWFWGESCVVPLLSERKYRLFAVACLRRIWPIILDERAKLIVEELERFADSPELTWVDWGAVTKQYEYPDGSSQAAGLALSAVVTCIHDQGNRLAQTTSWYCSGAASAEAPTDRQDARSDIEVRAHCNLIRELFGNPFRPVTFAPEWRTFTAVALAQQMYESRDFSAMPILADALQDAGCDSGDVLDHCRGAGPHVRGCWVVDMLLGKE